VETQNVTLSLPKNILRSVRILAAERGTSISALLLAALEKMAEEESGYAAARERQAILLERGFDLGLKERNG
jgi:hypothetical protein